MRVPFASHSLCSDPLSNDVILCEPKKVEEVGGEGSQKL